MKTRQTCRTVSQKTVVYVIISLFSFIVLVEAESDLCTDDGCIKGFNTENYYITCSSDVCIVIHNLPYNLKN